MSGYWTTRSGIFDALTEAEEMIFVYDDKPEPSFECSDANSDLDSDWSQNPCEDKRPPCKIYKSCGECGAKCTKDITRTTYYDTGPVSIYLCQNCKEY